jgi:hypothetical protein
MELRFPCRTRGSDTGRRGFEEQMGQTRQEGAGEADEAGEAEGPDEEGTDSQSSRLTK